MRTTIYVSDIRRLSIDEHGAVALSDGRPYGSTVTLVFDNEGLADFIDGLERAEEHRDAPVSLERP